MKGSGRQQNAPESGFALLFIFAMAAIVAITLYRELPRVAFEAQRDREQLLIDRGEQYSRAINLYVRKFNKYPPDFDALQSTQNLRFLRHKYIDPMTGKDDWRLIHVGPGGVFTDSLVYGKKKKDANGKDQPEPQTFITETQQTGGSQTGPNQQGGVNLATRQRQSDQPGAPGDPNNPAQPPQLDANGQPVPNSPTLPNGYNGPVQVLPDGRIVPVSQGNQPGNQPNYQQGYTQTGQPGAAGQFQPGVPGQFQPGVPNQYPSGAPGQFPPGVNQNPQQGGFPGQSANAPPAAAANLINQILTTPRPGGLNGLGGQQATVDQNGNPVQNQSGGAGFGANLGPTNTAAGNTATAAGAGAPGNTGTALPPMAGQTIGGGIAGVASKLEQDGIKVYKERTSYNEWEFVYDISKDPARGGGQQIPAPAANGTAAPAATGTAGYAAAASPFSNTFSSSPPPTPAAPTQTITPQ